MLTLVLAQRATPASMAAAADLRAELAALKPSALRRRALAVGVGAAALEDAEDAAAPRPAVVALIVAAEGGRAAGARGASG